jgi:GNAT superfamily N-acetyltransferase
MDTHPLIADHGLAGDLQTAALVSAAGVVDARRPDSAALVPTATVSQNPSTQLGATQDAAATRADATPVELIAAIEDEARKAGATRMRLDTRKDLVEARALYPRHGYVETADYNASPFADHWFEKPLV